MVFAFLHGRSSYPPGPSESRGKVTLNFPRVLVARKELNEKIPSGRGLAFTTPDDWVFTECDENFALYLICSIGAFIPHEISAFENLPFYQAALFLLNQV